MHSSHGNGRRSSSLSALGSSHQGWFLPSSLAIVTSDAHSCTNALVSIGFEIQLCGQFNGIRHEPRGFAGWSWSEASYGHRTTTHVATPGSPRKLWMDASRQVSAPTSCSKIEYHPRSICSRYMLQQKFTCLMTSLISSAFFNVFFCTSDNLPLPRDSRSAKQVFRFS